MIFVLLCNKNHAKTRSHIFYKPNFSKKNFDGALPHTPYTRFPTSSALSFALASKTFK
jgi:hypothetical protein